MAVITVVVLVVVVVVEALAVAVAAVAAVPVVVVLAAGASSANENNPGVEAAGSISNLNRLLKTTLISPQPIASANDARTQQGLPRAAQALPSFGAVGCTAQVIPTFHTVCSA